MLSISVPSAFSPAALLGTLVHLLFEYALLRKGEDLEELSLALLDRAHEILQENKLQLQITKIKENDARHALHTVIPEILAWIDKHAQHVREVKDIEELIWSPNWGLKGKIDATVTDVNGAVQVLELKSGRSGGSAGVVHHAQVALYMLLLEERYRVRVDKGVLVYLRWNKEVGGMEQKAVNWSRDNLVGFIMQRNVLVAYMDKEQGMPEMLVGREGLCAKCFVKESCVLHHKIMDNGDADSVEGPGRELYGRITDDLDDKCVEYYKAWRKVMFAEERLAREGRMAIWHGRGPKCLWGLKVHKEEQRRKDLIVWLTRDQGVENGIWVDGARDMVVVSAELEDKTQFVAVSLGFLVGVKEGSLGVKVEKSLTEWEKVHCLTDMKVTWRLDLEQSSITGKSGRMALEQLFVNKDMRHVRELIVQGKEPQFEKVEHVESNLIEKLNEDQRHAVLRAHAARDYLLVLGMPGTGKTTTTAVLVASMAKRGLSVLVCAHTNAAVDNVLIAIMKTGFGDFVRLGGNVEVLDERVRQYHEQKLMDEVAERKVIATTCLGVRDGLLERRGGKKFDVVVIDEAGQVLQAICLAPLRFGKGKFILVGDHYQLAPLAKGGKEVEEIGKESLFKRLCDFWPTAMVPLSKQYRMRSELMDLSNHVVYGGKLKAGRADSDMPKLKTRLPLAHVGPAWKIVLDSERAVVFLDVRKIAVRREKGGRRKCITEVDVTVKSVETFVKHGVAPRDVTVLTPYKLQAKLIRKGLKAKDICTSAFTIDEYQGKENQGIVASLVETESAGLLGDWRRLNVLLTRAQCKLVLIGNGESLLRSDKKVLRDLFQYLRKRGNVIEL